MKSAFGRGFTLTCVLAAALAAPSRVMAQAIVRETLQTADIAALGTPATVTIISVAPNGDTLGQGSGFVLRSDGVLLTNFHVLRGAGSALVILSSGERFTRVRVLDADSLLDLALLKIPAAGLTALPARTTTPRVGDRVVAIGSPLGLTRTVTDGIVSAVRLVEGRELIQISAPISPGSSGGAVLDASGKVFAVSTSQLSGGQALNFAVPVRYALGMLGDIPRETSIAEVFGGLGPTRRSSAEQPASHGADADQSDPGTARHPHPHASVDGTYAVTQLVVDAKGKRVAKQIGYLFATTNVGYLTLGFDDDREYRRLYVFNVRRWRTNAAGDLILSAGGVTYDGYQTADDGFLAYGTLSGDADSVMRLALGGVPKRLPLSENSGLYTAKTSTRYFNDGREVETLPHWTGEAAVAVAHDTIYVDLHLENSRGGSTAFVGSGPLLPGNRFELTGIDGASLQGSMGDGSLAARFYDKRDHGAFIHEVVADRR